MSRLHSPTPLPEVDQAASYAWFNGWWHGIFVGSVIGAGLVAALMSAGVLS